MVACKISAQAKQGKVKAGCIYIQVAGWFSFTSLYILVLMLLIRQQGVWVWKASSGCQALLALLSWPAHEISRGQDGLLAKPIAAFWKARFIPFAFHQ